MAEEVARGRRAAGDRLPAVRELARETGCAAGTAARAYTTLRLAGIVAGRDRARHVVAADGAARARAWLDPAGALRLAGSDDPALDLLVRAAGAPSPSRRGRAAASPGSSSSRAAARMPPRSICATPRPAASTIRSSARRSPASARCWCTCGGVSRDWSWPRATRSGSAASADLAGHRLAWRAPGTASRLLLERLLLEAGIDPRPGSGAAFDSHLGVAAAVGTGAADAGLAVRAVGRLRGAEWIPVVSRAVRARAAAGRPAGGRAAARRAGEHGGPGRRLAALPGYDLTESGRRGGGDDPQCVILAAALASGVLGVASCGGEAPASPTPAARASGTMILATTTSTRDSGLLDVLVPDFERGAECQVKTVAVGSGDALKLGETRGRRRPARPLPRGRGGLHATRATGPAAWR